MNSDQKIINILSKHKIRQKLIDKVEDWIELLTDKLCCLKDLPPQKFNDNFYNLLGNVKFPLNDQLYDYESSFLFQAPKIYTIGSLALGCSARNNENLFEIDLAFEISKSCWQKKDHLDYIYFWKRALYLAYIAKHMIQFDDIVSNVKYRYLNGNQLQPNLYVIPSGQLGLYCRFNIFATPTLEKSFVFKNFHLNKCNIRNVKSVENLNLKCTPYYNNSILSDLTLIYFVDNLSKLFYKWTNVQEALILIRVWLDKRNLRNQFAHIITVFAYYLITKKFVKANFSSLLVFKTILEQISKSDWKSNPPIINFDSECDQISFDCNHFPINFFDVGSNLNLCYNLNIGSYERLKIDCEHSLKILDSKEIDIMNIFNTFINFNFYFDCSINILVDHLNKDHLQNNSFYIDCGFNFIKAIVTELYHVFQLATGDRLSLIQHNDHCIYYSWEITSEIPKWNQNNYIVFGVQIKKENFLNVITKGPTVEATPKPDDEEFRKLWGKKSEIRRFQNGDIREAVYWECNTVQEKRQIIIQALRYILSRKMNLKLNTITWTFDYLDNLLEIKNIKFNDPKYHYGTGEECMTMISESLNVLKRYLHNLKLSFNVIDVFNLDPVFSEVFPPLPMNSRPKNGKLFCNIFESEDIIEEKIKYVKPVNMIVKIEAKRKLSNDLEEFINQKYLLYHELADVLLQTHSLWYRLNGANYLDIYFHGIVFRLILSIPQELSIYRQLSSNTKLVKMVENPEADQIEFKTSVLPAISQALGVFNNEHISYGLVCRIFKRWISRQMIKHFFQEITLDLLVAYSYDQCYHSFPSSNSHLSSFLRLLDFLINFDFVRNPIILNFNDGLSNERISNIEESFVTERSKWPIIFIVTPYDRKLSYHTISSPDTRIVFYMKKLAKHSLEELTIALSSFKPIKIKTLFKSNLDIFDIIIKLNSKHLKNKYQSFDFPDKIKIKHTLYLSEDENIVPITDFNPINIYLSQLKKAFNNIALFFYDEFGGLEIGVLLKPGSLEYKPFKYSTVEASLLTSTAHSLTTDNIILNLEGLIEDFKIMGQDLVESVVIKSEKLHNH